MLMALLAPHSGASDLGERELKAAYLYHFARFAQWSPTAFANVRSTLELCVFSTSDPFAGALAGIDRRSVQGREANVRRVSTATDLRGCHLVFIPEADLVHWRAALLAGADVSALTVSDGPGFADRGGHIELRPQGRRLGFVVNLRALRAAGIGLPAQLLTLAAEVKE